MDQQIEMRLGTCTSTLRHRAADRRRRAEKWFRRMRSVVDGAMDWPTVSYPRARQERLFVESK